MSCLTCTGWNHTRKRRSPTFEVLLVTGYDGPFRMNDPQATTLTGLALSAKSLRTKEQPISFLIAEALRNPRLINLAAGLVDPLTLPVEECAAITRRILSDTARGRAALQYDTTLGLADLRKTVLAHVEQMEGISAREMSLTENDFVVTTGS